jgi:hypothetical protein
MISRMSSLAVAVQPVNVQQERLMYLKIRNGTPTHSGQTLCATCRLSMIVRGRTLEEEIVHCHAMPSHAVPITFTVTSCSTYCDTRTPSYVQMLQSAWILKPRTRKRPAGFIRAADLSDKEMSELMIETPT